jgi:hypothetical protein
LIGLGRVANEFAGSPDPIRPSLHRVLLTIYDGKIRSLQGRLGQDLGSWLEPADP